MTSLEGARPARLGIRGLCPPTEFQMGLGPLHRVPRGVMRIGRVLFGLAVVTIALWAVHFLSPHTIPDWISWLHRLARGPG